MALLLLFDEVPEQEELLAVGGQLVVGAGALALAVFGLIAMVGGTALIRLHGVVTFHISLMVQIVELVVVGGVVVALLDVFRTLLEGSFQGLLKLGLVQPVRVEAVLQIAVLWLLVLHELPQLVLEVLALVLLVAVRHVLVL